jgi:hypothetical protein
MILGIIAAELETIAAKTVPGAFFRSLRARSHVTMLAAFY